MARALFPKKQLSLSGEKKQTGFTLTELLVAILVGGVITTILLGLVVGLLQTNQREAARSDTQREVQMALDYIARDLREAVYVYDGNCLVNTDRGTFQGLDLGCRGLLSALPTRIAGQGGAQTLPVLALWKAERLPESLQDNCRNRAADFSLPPAQQSSLIRGVPCVSGRMYTLIVYTLDWTPDDNKWRGRARIMRYRLPQYTSNAGSGRGAPSVTNGWTYPLAEGVGFENWPRDREGNLPGGYVRPAEISLTANNSDSYQVLLDYIDLAPQDGNRQSLFDENKLCPQPLPEKLPATTLPDGSVEPERYKGGYQITPNSAVANGRRGFYACVIGAESYGKLNQEVVVRINGNAAGRPGVSLNSEVPIQMETRVLTRGVINKNI